MNEVRFLEVCLCVSRVFQGARECFRVSNILVRVTG